MQPQSNPVAAGAAAGGSSASLAIVLVWLLGQFNIAMPTEVALALAAMTLPLLHVAILKLGAATAGAPSPPPAT